MTSSIFLMNKCINERMAEDYDEAQARAICNYMDPNFIRPRSCLNYFRHHFSEEEAQALCRRFGE